MVRTRLQRYVSGRASGSISGSRESHGFRMGPSAWLSPTAADDVAAP
jgi:hypothetical protein